MNKNLYLSLAVAVGLLLSCQSGTQQQSNSNSTETVSSGSTETEASASDTLRSSQQAVIAESGNLTAEGSSLSSEESNLNIDIQLNSDQLFDFDKATLKPEAEPALEDLAEQLKNIGDDRIEISGHTDSKGDDAYNEKLSLKRAEAVKSWLEAKGFKNNVYAVGKGEKEPIAENTLSNGQDNPEGRAKNRRVEIKYKGAKSISK